MPTAIQTNNSSRSVARPLKVLVPLIKEDLKRGDEAADQASRPYKRAAGLKLSEAKDGHQMTADYFVQWARKNFNLGKTQAYEYMSYAGATKNSAAADLPSLDRHLRDKGYNRDRVVAQPWHQPVQQSIDLAKRQAARLEEANLSKVREREEVRKLCLRIIDIGFKVLSKELHSDKGGSDEAMARLNRARDLLKASA